MAMTYSGIQYYPISVILFDEVHMELIDAKYGMKGTAAVMKLLCKIYKENGYYLTWNEEQCALFANKAGKEINAEEMQGVVDILVGKGFFDKETYENHQILTSIEVQKVWLEATKRRKRELKALPYLLVETEEYERKGDKGDKGDKGGRSDRGDKGDKGDRGDNVGGCMQKQGDCGQHADNSSENADSSRQSIVEHSRAEDSREKESRELPPLTPPGEEGGVWGRFSFVEFPGYAYNKKTHNLECLLLSLENLHIKEPDEVKAILKLSDYGRLGNEVWRIIHTTKWSMVNSNGKYLIGAMVKGRS